MQEVINIQNIVTIFKIYLLKMYVFPTYYKYYLSLIYVYRWIIRYVYNVLLFTNSYYISYYAVFGGPLLGLDFFSIIIISEEP